MPARPASHRPHKLPRRTLLAAALSATALALAGCSPDPAKMEFAGNNISGSGLGKDLDLIDAQGRPRTLADYRGKVVLVFFGYTQCPDVCPTSLAQAAQAMKLLGDKADQVQVLFITVDPKRDTPEIVGAYAAVFNPDFIGLTGSDEQIRKTAQSFKAFYSLEPASEDGQYGVNHMATFYLLDRQGEARVLLRADATPQDMAHDIKLLL